MISRMLFTLIGGISLMVAQDGGTKATVIIYRNSGAGTLKSPPVYLDGVQVAELGNKRYLSIGVSAGTRRFWSNAKEVLELNLKANGRYFIMAQYPDQGGIKAYNMRPRLRLFQVTVEQGERDIQNLNPLDSKHVFNAPVVPVR